MAGASPPKTLMAANSDNPGGYWESTEITQFNNRLLAKAGMRWSDHAPIPQAWFFETARDDDRKEAKNLLQQEFGHSDCFVLKDPRICRLLPFWLEVLSDFGIETHIITIGRDPLEVACSLAARAKVPVFRPASIEDLEVGLMLWFRYMLDLERHSRHLPRTHVSYADLVADWRTSLRCFFLSSRLPFPSPEDSAAIDAFIDPSLRRQQSDADCPNAVAPSILEFVRQIETLICSQDISASAEQLDVLDKLLDEAYSLSDSKNFPTKSFVPARLTAQIAFAHVVALSGTFDGLSQRPRVALFLSGSAKSIGHVYRVEHQIAALLANGWQAYWLPVEDVRAALAARGADMVVTFRAPWNAALKDIATVCRRQNIPLVYDIDDLIFDPAMIEGGEIAFLNDKSPEVRSIWRANAVLLRTAIESSDFAVLTTEPLAAAAMEINPNCFVVSNALGQGMENIAAKAAALPKLSNADGIVRMLFASGTPTHRRDFLVALDAVVSVLDRNQNVRLRLIGHIDPWQYPQLSTRREQIEQVDRVNLEKLFEEVAICDINLCPLEVGNPFCESKSAVRWLTAASVGVPTVASPTAPLQAAILHGHNGLLAANADQWRNGLEHLIRDASLRNVMGQHAKRDAMAQHGFDIWSRRVAATYALVLTLKSDRMADSHEDS